MEPKKGTQGAASKDSPQQEVNQARDFAKAVGISLDDAVKEAPAKLEKLKKLDRRINAASSRALSDRSEELQ